MFTCPYGGRAVFMAFVVMLMMGATLASPQARHLATCVTVFIEIDRRAACRHLINLPWMDGLSVLDKRPFKNRFAWEARINAGTGTTCNRD